MSNSYVKASFVVNVTAHEASLLREALEAIGIAADDTIDAAETDQQYAALSEPFRERFPATGARLISGFLDIFSDPGFPCFDTEVEFWAAPAPGSEAGSAVLGGDLSRPTHHVGFCGEQFAIDEVANLIHRLCPSALPFGFEWSRDCDKLRPGEFGGGYVVITSDGPSYHSTTQLLDAALAGKDNEVGERYVLTTGNAEHVLDFWNDRTGFGRMRDARVFSEVEAAAFDVPIAHDQPEWMAVPATMRRPGPYAPTWSSFASSKPATN